MARLARLLALSLLASCAAAAPLAAAPRPRRPVLRPSLRALRGGAAADAGSPLASPHSRTAGECLDGARVSPEIGLSSSRVEALRREHGHNALAAEPAVPLWRLFLAQFGDRLVQILLGVAAVSYGLARLEGEANGWVEPAVILGILLLNALVGVWQEASAADALDALQRLQPETARCLRDGRWEHELAAAELVPGDVIELRVGDRVPADARLLALGTTTLSADEASLTGESSTVGKGVEPVAADARIAEKACMLFAGSVVTNGRGRALVSATGPRTEMGRIQAGVQAAKADEERTPLAQKLDAFGNRLTYAIGAICVAVWAINIRNFWQPAFGTPWRGAVYYLKVAVALGVAAIPEGLPAVITLCLSLGTRRMAARRVIVRKLPSVETLGCTTVICTDKTGTLTTNQMSAVSLVLPQRGDSGGGGGGGGVSLRECVRRALLLTGCGAAGRRSSGAGSATLKRTWRAGALCRYEIEGVSYEPSGRILGLDEAARRGAGLAQLAAVATTCNDAEISYEVAEDGDGGGVYTRVGEPTEAALKVLFEKIGVPDAPPPATASDAAAHYGAMRAAEWEKLATLEFARSRKSMSVLVRSKGSGRNALHVKGAPELLLPRCTSLQLADGSVVRMSAEWRARIAMQVCDGPHLNIGPAQNRPPWNHTPLSTM